MAKYSGHSSFPFVKIGVTVVIGFNTERYEHLLKSDQHQPAAY
jgi:hypothetical protein